ncbi:MAG: protein kinase domain-containing protein [Gemmatimonadales bacterium]
MGNVSPADSLTRLQTALAGRYRLERELGRGAMATVYRAEDLKHDRVVAIKVLRPELVRSGGEAGRFLREIRIAARLSHPGILPLHDSGEVDGLLWYVMPFVRGESLRERLRREGRLPADEAVTIAHAIAQALDYAHRQNVIHRDIKPENVLLHEGQAVIADFGIARAITAAAGDNMTERGLAIGTPVYMSPEQAGGESELDGRTDLYALGCMLYEMLIGEPPFTGANARAVLIKHLTEPVPPLRDRRPTISPAFEAAVFRALAKEPGDRYASATDFAAALMAPATVPAPPPPRGERSLAVLPFANASAEPDTEYLSDGITEELINALANVDGLRVSSRTAVFPLKGQTESGRTLGQRLGVETVLEGSVRRSGGRIRITPQLTDVADGRLIWSERFDREMGDVFALEEEIARTIVAALRTRFLGDLGDPTPKRYTANLEAFNHYLRGRYAWNKRTQEGTLEAIRHFEAAIAEDPEYALAYTGLADSYALQVDYRGAPVTEGMRRAREEAQHAIALDEGLAEAHTSLGWVTFIHDWDWEAAGRRFARAIELNPRYATARQWHAWFLMAMGRVDEALAEGRMSQELDPASVSIRRSFGWLHQYARRWQESIPLLRQAVALNPVSDETLWALGVSLMEAGELDEAERVLRESEALADENFHAFATLGRLAVRRGNRDEAASRMERLQAIAGERYVSPVDFARLAIGLGDHDAAFHWIEQAHAERRGWLTYLRVDPLLDPLRGDRRYGEWLRRMGLD